VGVCLVVEGADDLSEAAAANDLEDLISVGDLVVQHLVVAAVFVVEASVVRRVLFRVHFAGFQAQVPHLRVLADLAPFVLRQPLAKQTQRFCKRNRFSLKNLRNLAAFFGC